MQNEVFCDSQMNQGFFQVSSFQLAHRSPRHMPRKRGPACRTRQNLLDKREREPGTGLTPDNKEKFDHAVLDFREQQAILRD